MEITRAQPPPPHAHKQPALDLNDVHRMEFPIFLCKPRRGVKRGDECKETYKLPHRLIEKKRRDRINECICQLKELLPEHLKLTTLGHLEKAVVLELTLKHVRTLTVLLEQQQQKIVALQKEMQFGDHGGDGGDSSEEMFRSGFHLCATELLHYLATQETSRELTPSRVMGHLHKVAAEVLQPHHTERVKKPAASSQAPAKNCVPVIQRTYQHVGGEQSGSDTDTDSGYGGEHDKAQWSESHGREGGLKAPAPERTAGVIKQEGGEPRAKRLRADSSQDEVVSGGGAPGSYMSFPTSQPPFCLPFYLVPPATAAYLPMLDKCWYPGGMPVMYPGMGGSAASLAPETLTPSLVMSPRAGSPVPHHNPDPPALHEALRQVSPLNLETKK